MQNEQEPDYRDSRQLTELAIVANEYCRFIENISKYQSAQVLEFLSRICPLLYIKGSLIEDRQQEEDMAEHIVTAETYEIVFNELRQVIGSNDVFYIFDQQLKEAVASSMAELFADVYQDLKDMLYMLSSPLSAKRQSANNECARLFKSHWGIRLATAMRQLHLLLYPDAEIDKGPVLND